MPDLLFPGDGRSARQPTDLARMDLSILARSVKWRLVTPLRRIEACRFLSVTKFGLGLSTVALILGGARTFRAGLRRSTFLVFHTVSCQVLSLPLLPSRIALDVFELCLRPRWGTNSSPACALQYYRLHSYHDYPNLQLQRASDSFNYGLVPPQSRVPSIRTRGIPFNRGSSAPIDSYPTSS